MRKILLYTLLILCLWIVLAQCVVFKFRWSDSKAHKLFAARQVPLDIHDTIIDKRHLHYAISGSDSLPSLIFLHGSPGSSMNYAEYMWDPDLQKKFRLVSIDRPGFGFSDFGQPLHLQDQCKLILPLLQSLKTKQPMYVCGHSLGAPIAIQLAASDPNLFETIIIASGSIDAKQEKKETWRKIMNVRPLYWLFPGALGPSNTELIYLKTDLLPLQQEFKKVTCKVHFIHGDKDKWVPIQNIAYGTAMLINAEKITIDTIAGAQHLIPWKNKKEFRDMLLNLY
ncbi:alpha/beta fold hydrolase [Terrimonas pollutisoli]|uniref:alpha/beta fold hydrolase n=1 Tax=Terrimonas pollutisoli TaxID=3034147 RepID=UPI0023ED342A|nr:alpha/beta hydrolase [Terrimonas sp. H1YJ31]